LTRLPYKSWVFGRASCRSQRGLSASQTAKISEKALF
jgi:hypothetical protein